MSPRSPASFLFEDFTVARLRAKLTRPRRHGPKVPVLSARAKPAAHQELLRRTADWFARAGGAASLTPDQLAHAEKIARARIDDDKRVGRCLCAACGACS